MALTPGRFLMFFVACFSLVAMPIAAVLDHVVNLIPRRY